MTDWAHDYFERGYSQRWTLGPPSEDTRREASELWDRLRLAAGAGVLDVGCGHGRHALALAQRGANVTGLDFSAHLLARARELAAALDLSVSWMRGDMRALPIRDDSIYAAMLFDAFGFFDADEDNLHALREVARVLVTGGRLALKVVNGEPIMRRFRASDREERGDTTVVIERTLLTNPPRLVEDLAVSGPRGHGRYQRRQRLYRIHDITSAMSAIGLTTVDVFDDGAGGPFKPETSGTMLIIAESRGS